MGSTTLFGNIHGPYCTISTNFYLYLQDFQQKVFSFYKISISLINPKCAFGIGLKRQFFFLILLFSLFLLLFMVLLHFLVLFISPTILFQLPFNFIYNTFNKNFLVSAKWAVPKWTLSSVCVCESKRGKAHQYFFFISNTKDLDELSHLWLCMPCMILKVSNYCNLCTFRSFSTELLCLVLNHLPPLMPHVLSSPNLKVLLYLMTPSINKLLALLVYLILPSLSIHELIYLWSLDNC